MLYALFVVFNVMARDDESGGSVHRVQRLRTRGDGDGQHVGGDQESRRRYRAFIIVPLVGASSIDIASEFLSQFFLDLG